MWVRGRVSVKLLKTGRIRIDYLDHSQWYLWHAPDGLRALAATALGCMQACIEKLGVIEASYASAIIRGYSPLITRHSSLYDARLLVDPVHLVGFEIS